MTRMRLADTVEILNGFAFDSALFNDAGIGMPIVRIRDVVIGATSTWYSGEFKAEYIVRQGDILIGMDGEFNIAEWRSDAALLNQRVCKVIPRLGIDPTFIKYLIGVILKEIEDATPFVTVKHLSSEDLKQVEIEIPPLAEQRRIAAILRAADDERRRRRYTQSLSDGLLREVFVRMFGDPATNPMGWEVRKLGDFIYFVTSGSRGWAEYYADSGAKFIRVQNLHEHVLDLDDIAHVTPPQSAEAARTRVQPNDLLLAITGATIGLSALVPDGIGEAYVSQHVAIIRLGAGINPVFASSFISHPRGGQLQISAINYGDTKPGLSLDQIRDMDIMCPPTELQCEFAAIVVQHEQTRRQQQESARQSDYLFAMLLHRAFAGEL